MRSEVLVALLVTGVLGDEVEVLAADDEGSVHLGGNDSSGEDTATDGDLADEWALLVCDARNVSSCSSLRFPPIFVAMRHQELEYQHSPPLSSEEVRNFPPHPRAPSNFVFPSYFPRVRCRHTNVGSLNGGLWGPEPKTNILIPSASSLASSRRLGLDLGVKEDMRLLLESALGLDGQFGGHFCVWWIVAIVEKSCKVSSLTSLASKRGFAGASEDRAGMP